MSASLNRLQRLTVLLMVALSMTSPAAAMIFGENDLPDLKDRGITSQCDLDPGIDAPPVGKFFGIRNGFRFPMGSGATVGAPNIVVTSAHSFAVSGRFMLQAGDRVIFAVYELVDGTCQRIDHEVADPLTDIGLGSLDPQGEPESDFAIVTLADPVDAYDPMEIAPTDMVERAIHGEYPLTLESFPNHPSADSGDSLTMVSCHENVGDMRGTKYAMTEWMFVNDCDAWDGSSGGPFAVIRDATDASVIPGEQAGAVHRYFVGIVHGEHNETAKGANISASQDSLSDVDARFTFRSGRTYNFATALSPLMRSRLRRAIAASQADGGEN